MFDADELALAQQGVFENETRRQEYEKLMAQQKHPSELGSKSVVADKQVPMDWDWRALFKTVILCGILITPVYLIAELGKADNLDKWQKNNPNWISSRLAAIDRAAGRTTSPAIKADNAAKAAEKVQQAKKQSLADEGVKAEQGWLDSFKTWSMSISRTVTAYFTNKGDPAVVNAAATQSATQQTTQQTAPKTEQRAETPPAGEALHNKPRQAPAGAPAAQEKATPELDALNSKLDSILAPE